MDHLAWSGTAGLPPRWLEPIRIAAQELGLDFDPVPVRGWLTGSELITTVRSLGGTIRTAAPFHGWILAKENDGSVEPIARFAPESRFSHCGLTSKSILGRWSAPSSSQVAHSKRP